MFKENELAGIQKRSRKNESIELNRKGTEEIDRVAENLMIKIKEAAEKHSPKIKYRRIPHPEIDNELKELMKQTSRIKILLANQIDYINNKRRFNEIREEIRIKWGLKREEMWKNLMLKKIQLNFGMK